MPPTTRWSLAATFAIAGLTLLRPTAGQAADARPTPGAASTVKAANANNANKTAPVASGRSSSAILADHIQAIGGAKALQKHRSLRMVRKVTVKGMGIEGTEERFAAAGNKFLSRTTIPGIGVVRQGSDGRTSWSDDPINGLRVLAGLEAEQSRRDGRWNAELYLAELYDKITVVPAPVNAPTGAALECVELAAKSAPPLIVCFDQSTHQRVFQTGRQATPQGEIPFEARFSQWRSYGGVSLPTVEETKAGPTTIIATVSEVKFDEKLDPGLFKLRKLPAKPATDSRQAPAPTAAP